MIETLILGDDDERTKKVADFADPLPGNPLSKTLMGIGTGASNDFQAEPAKVNEDNFQLRNYSLNRDRMHEESEAVKTRQAASMNAANINTSQQAQFRHRQGELANALEARMNGQGTSVAELQMNKGLNQAIASQRSAAASARGMSPAQAQRMAAQNVAQLQQGVAADKATLRAGEQEAAAQQLAQLSTQARGQDIGMATDQAGLNQQSNVQNLQTEMQQRQMNDQATQYYNTQGLGLDAQKTQNLMQMEALKSSNYNAAQNVNAATAEANTAREQQAQGGLLSAAGAVVGGVLSDIRVKKDVKKGDDEVREFFGDASNEDLERRTIEARKFDEDMMKDPEKARESMGQEGVDYYSGMERERASKMAKALAASPELRRDFFGYDYENEDGPPAGSPENPRLIAPSGSPKEYDEYMARRAAEKSAPVAETPKEGDEKKSKVDEAIEAMKKNQEDQEAARKKEEEERQKAFNAQLAGALAQAGATYGGKGPQYTAQTFSDKKGKKSVKKGERTVGDFLDALEAYEWKYKDPERYGTGKQFGVMAQDLEKAGPVGKSMVKDTPQGKVVDMGRGYAVVLAAQADHEKRLKEIETKYSRSK